MECKPKSSGMLFSPDWRFIVECYPQQKWQVEKYDEKEILISRKGVTIRLTNEEFEKGFEVK